MGSDIISSYKRASNILESELKDKTLEISNTTDPGIFKNEYEKNLYKKIKQLRISILENINKDENYNETLVKSSKCIKTEVFEFFDNVIVNDE